jgi:hypothetical protein
MPGMRAATAICVCAGIMGCAGAEPAAPRTEPARSTPACPPPLPPGCRACVTYRPGIDAPANRRAPGDSTWRALFDGEGPTGLRIVEAENFKNHGAVTVRDGRLILAPGKPATGVSFTAAGLPRDNYEISLEAMRTDGSDFFCGLTFPIGAKPCTLILGGWGGGAVGLSNVDGGSAVDNETARDVYFDNNRWYRVRLRVTTAKVEAWLDDEKIIDLDRKGPGGREKRFSIWYEQEPVLPLGVATWYTGAALRDIRIRSLNSLPR